MELAQQDDASANCVYMSGLFKYKSQKTLDNRVRLVIKLDSLEFYDIIWENGANRSELSRILALNDLSGVFIEQSFSPYDQNAYLVINAYPRHITQTMLASMPNEEYEHKHPFKRIKICIELAFCKYPTSDQNYEHLKSWHAKLNNLINLSCHSVSTWSSSGQAERTKEQIVSEIFQNPDAKLEIPKKRFLIFINPHSGSGKASQLFLKNAAPVFAEAQIYNKLVLTERSNHAFEFVQRADLSQFSGILVVSGDGLIYEVINGLMNRPDWQKSVRIPVGQLPGGSANGLACTISYLTNEYYKDLATPEFSSLMAFYFTKSLPTPMKLTRIQLENGKVLHSFLNVEWGMAGDVDLESERYRFLASQRFLVGTLARLINLRVYKGRASFLPIDEDRDWKPKNPLLKVTQKPKQASETSKPDNRLKDKKSFQYCTPFDQPVPEDWFVVEDDFLMFLVLNLPVMGQDMFIAPKAKFNEEFVYLAFVNGQATRFDLLKLFLEGGTGNFFEGPRMEVVRAKAFRLEPFTAPYNPSKTSNFGPNDGALMVDGERVAYGNIQGECIPSMANVLARNDF